ncbi:competence/damage-inducible protein A [Oceanihabitans sediminis]|uniref:CinA-like protein n=1 Tax=Oceanihabitans sediminis TaxID=1812012 RepID=A0A368P3X0_9FLAO|nr:competence/damage-inducible protein A [Oceanihabitans sediminis]MDX1278110.1 competence/damage-inducible protein A [Oceanihabitans sediminis]RBP29812.1 nicotinamide-nucleotide amidase [Oceanihabitans sediminis]RCU57153.1 competence/damage-inducible protein A [Oceanihabitans sediminis]
MQAEIITIGDEILIGQIVDTNSAFIAKQLNKIGVSVYQITSVQDEEEHILKSLKEAEENADIIILTGGLGPTKDDITKNTLAAYFQDTLVQDEAVLENIKFLWENYVQKPLSQLNIDQALIPSKAIALMNKVGSAPGMWMEKGNKTFISLPGVPFEMETLIQEEVLPRLQKKYKSPYILHRTLLTYGLGESSLAELIEDWEANLPKHIKLAYLPNLGKVRLRISAKGFHKEQIIKEVDEQIQLLLPLIKEYFTGFEDLEETIEALVAKQFIAQNKTLSAAESCTGGKIAERITEVPGASNYFKGSIVSYATEVKTSVLKVSEELIKKHSVVSAEVAEAMAVSALKLFETDYAIATTGNAGPTKGDSDAEVGTVYIAIARKGFVYSEKYMLGNHRVKVINKAVNKAFEMLQKEFLKNR